MKKITALLMAFSMILAIVPKSYAADKFNYSELITPQYEDAKAFSSGLAPVKKAGKWGFIDRQNKAVIDFKYDYASYFSEGKAIVGTLHTIDISGGKYTELRFGSVDHSGNYTAFTNSVAAPIAVAASATELPETNFIYYNGYAIIDDSEGGTFCVNSSGKEANMFTKSSSARICAISSPTEGIFATTKPAAEYFHYTDMQGNLLFPTKNFAYGHPFNQGLAPVTEYSENSQSYMYFINTSGERALPINFSNFYMMGYNSSNQVFNDGGLASLADMSGRWGAINKSGTIVVPFQYDELRSFNEGVACFGQDDKFGFIDTTGKVVIPAQFDDASTFLNGIAVVRMGDTAYCIDKKGNKIAGADKLPVSSYFIENSTEYDGTKNYVVFAPGSTVTIEENGKYGYGSIEYTPALPEKSEMSAWAYTEVVQAIEKDLVPANLQNMYTSNTSRVDFAALVVTALEETLDKDIADIVRAKTGETIYQLVAKYPFKDTTDYNVIAAYALGIINGVGNGDFAPESSITRQDAAVLLTKTAKFLGYDNKGTDVTFADSSNVRDYAKESVQYAAKMGLMGGVGESKFAPDSSYTREQTFMTMLRLFNAIVTK